MPSLQYHWLASRASEGFLHLHYRIALLLAKGKTGGIKTPKHAAVMAFKTCFYLY